MVRGQHSALYLSKGIEGFSKLGGLDWVGIWTPTVTNEWAAWCYVIFITMVTMEQPERTNFIRLNEVKLKSWIILKIALCG
jgi:hypothetical protein